MDETSGTTMHDAVGSADGRLTNVTTGVSGHSRTAYRFNGTSSLVTVPHRAALNPGPSTLTVQVWARFTIRPTGDYDLLRKGLASTPGGYYKVEIVRSGQAVCLFGGSVSSWTLIGGRDLSDGRWHSITCRKTLHQVTLLVDGTIAKQRPRTIGSIANSATLILGAKPGADFYRGVLDEAKISVG
jgi:hypothetical protein